MSDATRGRLHDADSVMGFGPKPADARAVAILLHGRGANAQDILALARAVAVPEMLWLAPQATNDTWYPWPFMAPLDSNEPWLTSALGVIGALVDRLAGMGIPREKVAIGGFSQGACLSLEFAARHPARYGAIFALSGGLIGPEGTAWNSEGSLAGTPIFLGCSDVDAHIPLGRVKESTAALSALGAEVTERIYPGMGHTVNDEEVGHVRRMAAALVA